MTTIGYRMQTRDHRSRLYGCWMPVVAANLVSASANTALAHGGPLDRPAGWADWNLDPVLLIVLTAIGWTYARGLSRIWERVGVGRVVGRPQAGSFATGMVMLLAALVSPLDPLSDQLAWVHMTQHMLLMTVAAPLIVVGSPTFVLLWGLSPPWRRALARLRSRLAAWRILSRWLWQPLVVWGMYALVMWVWHAPPLYEAALVNPFVHDFQHVTFFVAACLFWRVPLDPIGAQRLAGLLAVVYLFTTTLHATVLGVLMTLAPTPWYAEYEGRTALWGLTTLEDQQLAGLIMWMPACAAYLVVAVILFANVLADGERDGEKGRGGERENAIGSSPPLPVSPSPTLGIAPRSLSPTRSAP